MDELIKEFLSNFGLPSIIIPILVLAFKLSPITSLSSSPIEMKLSTKEKRSYVTVIRSTYEIIGMAIINLLITYATYTSFASKKIKIYNPTIGDFILAEIIFLFWAVVTLLIMIQYVVRNKTIFDIENEKLKFCLRVLLFLYSMMILLLPGFVLGIQTVENTILKKEAGYEIAYFTVWSCFLALLFYFISILPCQKFLSRSINLKVRINYGEWFILHPMEKELFLLGDNSEINKCTQIKVIEKKELLKNKIDIIKNS